ncbi:MAG: agmatine deiminase family protein [Gammaproteobacteria bacterium]|nr:MAG: agmatine deiminase family protein [Gammaproteobacteria bacterium]
MEARLPAEWEPHDGVLIVWPHPDSDWGPCIDEVEAVYDRLAVAIADQEPLLVLCRDEAHRAHVADRLLHSEVQLDAVRLFTIPTNDTWIRDYGPVTVYEGTRPFLEDFQFNGYGRRYPYADDNQATARLFAAGAFGETPLRHHDLVLEGGAFDSDGAGSLLVTERCLLEENRNPGMTRERWEAVFARVFGTRRVLWLTEGRLAGDDTDGHVDMLARFCNPTTIAYCQADPHDREHHDALAAMEQELRALRRPDGKPYTLLPLPLPAPLHHAGERLPASYVNFLILRQAVLVPAYDDPQDVRVLERLERAFPDRALIPVPARILVRQKGALHCATLPLGRGVLSPGQPGREA